MADVSEYERARLVRIAENQARFNQLFCVAPKPKRQPKQPTPTVVSVVRRSSRPATARTTKKLRDAFGADGEYGDADFVADEEEEESSDEYSEEEAERPVGRPRKRAQDETRRSAKPKRAQDETGRSAKPKRARARAARVFVFETTDTPALPSRPSAPLPEVDIKNRITTTGAARVDEIASMLLLLRTALTPANKPHPQTPMISMGLFQMLIEPAVVRDVMACLCTLAGTTNFNDQLLANNRSRVSRTVALAIPVLRLVITVYTNKNRMARYGLPPFSASDVKLICMDATSSFISPQYQPINPLGFNAHAGVACCAGLLHCMLGRPMLPLAVWSQKQRTAEAPCHLTLRGSLLSPEAWVVAPVAPSRLSQGAPDSPELRLEMAMYKEFAERPFAGTMRVAGAALAKPLLFDPNPVRVQAAMADPMATPAAMCPEARRRLFADPLALSRTADHEATSEEFHVGVVAPMVPFLDLMLRTLDTALGQGSLTPERGICPAEFAATPGVLDPTALAPLSTEMNRLESQLYAFVR